MEIEIKKPKAQILRELMAEEYITLICQDEDIIGLYGNQPTLRKVRESWQNGELEDDDLMMMVNYMVTELKLKPEPFENVLAFGKHIFPNIELPREKPIRPELSEAEKLAFIRQAFEDKKKPKRKTSKPKPVVTVDRSKLPASLQKFAK